MLRVFAVSALTLFGSLAAQAAETGAKAPDVQQWIAQLDNEKFKVREDATDKLITTEYKAAIKDIVRTAEAGSAEASTRALHILTMWHRADETSRDAVMAIATSGQAEKRPQLVRLGKRLAVKTRPKPVAQPPQPGKVIFLGGGDRAVLAAPFAVGFPIEAR